MLVLGCATRAIGQTESIHLEDTASVYVPVGWEQPKNPAQKPVAPSQRNALAADSGDSGAGTNGAPAEIPASKERFQWKPALAQSLLGTAIYHGWRFAHESGTRDALYGPWLKDWLDSIGETRGWDDGDGWHASYVSHPFEGGIFGFIEQQNARWNGATDVFTG